MSAMTLGQFRALTEDLPDDVQLHHVANYPTEDGIVQSASVDGDAVTFFLVDSEEAYGED